MVYGVKSFTEIQGNKLWFMAIVQGRLKFMDQENRASVVVSPFWNQGVFQEDTFESIQKDVWPVNALNIWLAL